MCYVISDKHQLRIKSLFFNLHDVMKTVGGVCGESFVNLFPNRNVIHKKISEFFAYFSIKAVPVVAY